VHVDPIKPMLKPPETKHLKLQCDELLSSFAFKFKLRRYTPVLSHRVGARAAATAAGAYTRPLFRRKHPTHPKHPLHHP